MTESDQEHYPRRGEGTMSENSGYAFGMNVPARDDMKAQIAANANARWGYDKDEESWDLDEDGEPTDAHQGYITKDSGIRTQYDSGMMRDTQAGKARFDLLVPEGVPFNEQMLTRVAELFARGAEKYSDRNWEQANSQEEFERMQSSAFRHFVQWLTLENDEDHAAAVIFNLIAAETTRYKIVKEGWGL